MLKNLSIFAGLLFTAELIVSDHALAHEPIINAVESVKTVTHGTKDNFFEVECEAPKIQNGVLPQRFAVSGGFSVIDDDGNRNGAKSLTIRASGPNKDGTGWKFVVQNAREGNVQIVFRVLCIHPLFIEVTEGVEVKTELFPNSQ